LLLQRIRLKSFSIFPLLHLPANVRLRKMQS
jgi:hypothetical protein